MRLDENEQMVSMLHNALGSFENKIRQAYNSGYSDGFKAGAKAAFDDINETLEKSLRRQIEQTDCAWK